jgi:hypothetical protein
MGAGFTVIVKEMGEPMHPLAEGVTVIMAEIGSGVKLVVLKTGMLVPVPLAASPIAVLLLVQLKLVPGTGPEIVMAGVKTPLQKERLGTAVTEGIG